MEELIGWIATVTPGDLPEPPFALHRCVAVVDPTKFLEKLQGDSRLGEASPRARFGALKADLEQTHVIVEGCLPW